eukprot:g51980.t1
MDIKSLVKGLEGQGIEDAYGSRLTFEIKSVPGTYVPKVVPWWFFRTIVRFTQLRTQSYRKHQSVPYKIRTDSVSQGRQLSVMSLHDTSTRSPESPTSGSPPPARRRPSALLDQDRMRSMMERLGTFNNECPTSPDSHSITKSLYPSSNESRHPSNFRHLDSESLATSMFPTTREYKSSSRSACNDDTIGLNARELHQCLESARDPTEVMGQEMVATASMNGYISSIFDAPPRLTFLRTRFVAPFIVGAGYRFLTIIQSKSQEAAVGVGISDVLAMTTDCFLWGLVLGLTILVVQELLLSNYKHIQSEPRHINPLSTAKMPKSSSACSCEHSLHKCEEFCVACKSMWRQVVMSQEGSRSRPESRFASGSGFSKEAPF